MTDRARVNRAASSRNAVEAVVRALRDKDCPYLGDYKLGYDAALDDVLRELPRYEAARRPTETPDALAFDPVSTHPAGSELAVWREVKRSTETPGSES